MGNSIHSVRDLVGCWPSRRAFAAVLGVPLDRVHKWVSVSSIPAQFHLRILQAAQAAGMSLSAEDILRAHARCPAAAVREAAE